MPTYLSPGVYVEEIPSGSAPIAGVGTSTAGFIGVISSRSIDAKSGSVAPSTSVGEGSKSDLGKELPKPSIGPSDSETKEGSEDGNLGDEIEQVPSSSSKGKKSSTGASRTTEKQVENPDNKSSAGDVEAATRFNAKYNVVFVDEVGKNRYRILETVLGAELGTVESRKEAIKKAATEKQPFFLPLSTPVGQGSQLVAIEVGADRITKSFALLENTPSDKALKFSGDGAVLDGKIGKITADYQRTLTRINLKTGEIETWTSVAANEVKLCTSFEEFKEFFGDFTSPDPANIYTQNTLAHAVFGFFRNGGTKCYVTWIPDESKLDEALGQFEAIDEIAIVVAPGVTNKALLSNIDAHCRTTTQDRVAIFDVPKDVNEDQLKPGKEDYPDRSDYAALYYPWIKVYDPVLQRNIEIPPSGHIAGVYARVDTQRGVFKAPANEPILGALDVTQNITKRKQDGLNPQGVNCIRKLDGSIRIWGARTWGGDKNGEFTYISSRRYFNYLRESIDEGTQWAVFEPNNPELWAKIRRNVSAFLLNEWRQGALFGSTPEEAFFVKCDATNNPPAIRDLGQVVTEIGVALVKPAEFVIFRISQWSAGG